jgi:solute carrier family 13 (sodium-dependent dicarboxylate transporter), member 2/3/5
MPEASAPVRPLKKMSAFFFLNLILFIILTALQFFLCPDPVWGRFNMIDILFIVYLILFIFFAFMVPRGRFNWTVLMKNIVFFLMICFLFPVIFFNETYKDIKQRFHLQQRHEASQVDKGMEGLFNAVWSRLFHRVWGDLRQVNRHAFISANRIIYDLPFFGLTFMGMVLIVLLFLINLGNDPATPQIDGYVFHFLEDMASGLFVFQGKSQLFWLFFMVILTSIFLTEVVSNTTVVLVTFPILTGLAVSGGFNPLFLLLSLAVASNGAFMTPIATSVNAVSYAGIPGISLKKMLFRGFFLNISAAVYLAATFYLFEILFP